jgi:hypothetical protein
VIYGLVAGALGQPCEPTWDLSIGNPGMDANVNSIVLFDDGGGPALFATGRFRIAGGTTANCIAKWDGRTWSPLGSGLSGGANGTFGASLVVFDDGQGPALFVVGNFTHAGGLRVGGVAKWDGRTWLALGGGLAGGVLQTAGLGMTVFDNGGGPALYVCGEFNRAGGVTANNVARWDGQFWSPLAAGVCCNWAEALAVFDDGTGPALYMTGFFTSSGGTAVNHIAKWNGVAWSPLLHNGDPTLNGVGFRGEVLTVHDDGGGSALYVGGWFTEAGGMQARYIARWSENTWSPLDVGLSSNVFALAEFDNGGGPDLFVGGIFRFALGAAGPVPALSVARWDGSEWFGVESGLNNVVRVLTPVRSGPFQGLYAGGWFTATGTGRVVNRIARWGVIWGDLDCDRAVDLVDLGILLADFGCTGGNCPGDTNGDGRTDLADLGILLTNFGHRG